MAFPSPLNVPPSNSTVNVSIIDTTSRITGIRTTIFMEPDFAGFKTFDACAYSFLITHTDLISGRERRLLFDLGIRKDWTNLAPQVVERVKSWGCGVSIEKNVSEILMDSGVDPGSIEAVIWSHAHWDHIGDMSTFPSKVDLVVGPGIKESYSPGYPANPKAPILESDFANRSVSEISFDSSILTIGGFRALDYFDDGSFYLLDAPGHAIGHLNALARTYFNPDTFMYLGADSFHHGAQLRPNQYLPFPESVDLSTPQNSSLTLCPGELLTSLHPTFTSHSPFLRISIAPNGTSVAISPSAANETIGTIQAFDADPNVFVVTAHDLSLYDMLEYFPNEANEWKSKAWKERGRWRYLKDFGLTVRAWTGREES